MKLEDIFGTSEVVQEEAEYKMTSISPFDFINSINYTKEDIIVADWSERQYNSYVINRGLSFGPDTIIQANEMNSRPHLDKKLQYQFLINIIRPRKRYNKWLKAEKIESIEVIKTYYGYSTDKARQALSILNPEQIDKLKQKLKKGGL